MATKPTHEQATLQLTIYDQRREPKLREARDWFFKNYHAQSMEEAMKLGGPGTENGARFMMVVSYWEQACALLNYGLLHEEFFFETSGEFFGTWERVKPIVKQGRDMFKNKQWLGQLETAAKRFEEWSEKRNPGSIEHMRQFMKQMSEQLSKSAKA